MSEKVEELYQDVAEKSSDEKLVARDGDYICPACRTGECLDIGCDAALKCGHNCTEYAVKMNRRPSHIDPEQQ